jgi:hypothetical protein
MLIRLICAAIAFLVAISAQSGPINYLVVDSVEPGANVSASPSSARTCLPVTFRMHNVGAKAITAYRVSLALRYADGSTSTSGWTEDCAYTIAEMTTPGVIPIPNSTLNPGESHVITQSILLARGSEKPVEITPSVTMLVFDDRTGLGDPGMIRKVFEGRQQAGKELSELLSEVHEAEGSRNPDSRYRELIAANRSDGVRHGGLGTQLTRLELYSKARGTPTFNLMMKVDEAARRASIRPGG